MLKSMLMSTAHNNACWCCWLSKECLYCSTYHGLKHQVDEAMNRAIYDATEENVNQEPLLSEILKQFHKESAKLTNMASDKFQKDKKARKKDEATHAMLQFGRSVTAKQVAPVVPHPYAVAAAAPAPAVGLGRARNAGPIHAQVCRWLL